MKGVKNTSGASFAAKKAWQTRKMNRNDTFKTHRQIGNGHIITLFRKTPTPRRNTDIVCPHFYELKWAYGCPYNCAYCYLMGTFRFKAWRRKDRRVLPTFKPRPKIERAVKTFLNCMKQPAILNTGELADSLMGENQKPPFSKFITDLFEGTPHKVLFLTKGTFVKHFLENEWQKNAILSWSINAPAVARRYEKLAPTPIDRIKAARQVYEHGYEVRIRLDPMVPIHAWQGKYEEIISALARHFLRHCSGSVHSIYSYVNTIQKYSAWLGYGPDMIIRDVKPSGAIPDPQRVQNHLGFLEDYLAELQDEGLSPGRVHCYAKHIKTFYRVNGVKIELTEPLSRRVTYKDRAPKPEELTRLLDIANLREKVIVSTLALAAFREETLSKLQYRHVKEDLEKDVIPIHVHVEAEITKGKYHDYDTFLGTEAAQYLKLYLQIRRRGSPDGRRPPENLTDESPLIRNDRSHTPGP